MTTHAAFLDAHDPLPVQSSSRAAGPSRRAVRLGRGLSGFAALFLGFDLTLKLTGTAEAAAATAELGWSPDLLVPLGLVELAFLIVYLIPRTAPLGAVLWTGYLGGAIATHLRVGNPLASHTLFPIYVAALLWGGLWLRDRRVRGLLAGR
jgi:hypothetical protein